MVFVSDAGQLPGRRHPILSEQVIELKERKRKTKDLPPACAGTEVNELTAFLRSEKTVTHPDVRREKLAVRCDQLSDMCRLTLRVINFLRLFLDTECPRSICSAVQSAIKKIGGGNRGCPVGSYDTSTTAVYRIKRFSKR